MYFQNVLQNLHLCTFVGLKIKLLGAVKAVKDLGLQLFCKKDFFAGVKIFQNRYSTEHLRMVASGREKHSFRFTYL